MFEVVAVFDPVLLCLQTKRDILSETKYIELVLVADHQEVREVLLLNTNIR